MSNQVSKTMEDLSVNMLAVRSLIKSGDKVLMIGADEEFQIEYDNLASALLDKLLTKNFSSLETVEKTMPGAVNELKEEVAAFITEVGERIDTIISNNNPTEGNSELVDIRVGAGGEAYNSAGAAVRGQISDVRTMVNERIQGNYSINLFDKSRLVVGKMMTGNPGESVHETAKEGYAYYEFALEGAERYTVTGTSHLSPEVDSDGKVIVNVGKAGNVESLNFGKYNDYVRKIYLNINLSAFPEDTYMLVKGNELPVEYSEYKEPYYTFRGASYYASIPELQEALSELKNIAQGVTIKMEDMLDEVVELHETSNLFDSGTAVSGKYITGDVGAAIAEKGNVSFWYCVFPVESGKTYAVTGTSFYAIFTDDSDIVIKKSSSPSQNIADFSFSVTDPKITKVYINASVTAFPIESYMIVEGASLPEKYEPYYKPYYAFRGNQHYATLDDIKEMGSGKTYHVGSIREYKSLTECLKALQDDSSEKTIYIDGGEYNVFEEIGGSEYALSLQNDPNEWREVSVVVPPNTTIIGIGNVVLNFLPEKEEIGETASKLLSPLNISGSCTVENITIKAKNCRYCIHDETSGLLEYKGAVKKYKNVRCIKTDDGGIENNIGYQQAYASGFDDDMTFVFENCHFKSFSIAWSCHNRDTVSLNNSSRISFVNTIFEGDGECFVQLGNINWRQEDVKVDISNCYLNKKIRVSADTEYGNKNAYDITVLGGNSFDIDVETTENIYEPAIFR